MGYLEIIKELKSKANPKNVEGMARFGISQKGTLGISIYDLRPMAKKIGNNHEIALKLWHSGIHEAQILASFVDEPEKVTEKQMEEWVLDFESWDVTDQVCSNLFDRTVLAYKKALEWSKRKEEFVKRSGFVLMAALSVHNKGMKNKEFKLFFKSIKREATDERNFVRKAVNWALRQIGKSRNIELYKEALKTAYEIREIDSKTAKWIAGDAIRELENPKIKARFK